MFRTAFKAWTLALLCCVLIGSLLTACSSNMENSMKTSEQQSAISTASVSGEKSSELSGERMVIDELGHEIKVPVEPKRIFAPNLEDSVIKLGVKPVAQWSNGNRGHDYLQEELKDVPKIDLSGGLPSPEVLMTYNPDLIILHTATFAQNGTYESYSKIAPTYVFNNASGNIEKSLTILGELLGKSNEADNALQAYQQKVNNAKEKLDKAVGGKKVAIIRFAAKGVSLMGGKYLCGYVVHENLGLGISRLVEKKNSANVSLEILPQIDADYIFVINAYGQGTGHMKEMMKNPIWKNIPAVKQGQVYEVDNKYWLGSGLIAYEKIVDDTVRLLAK
ncbi:ABC transporter substrate-binding protein [Aneurinibacillus migulanus]|nr:ABC transporter substrate-binding protein [Aneurinibacillus migulanus]KPD06973.1 ABC transporter substrate-binding protein [Aneurinibacillus migulanus]CEH29135.1 Periplasmic-binding protein [Aneurinibacillus migulanus]